MWGLAGIIRHDGETGGPSPIYDTDSVIFVQEPNMQPPTGTVLGDWHGRLEEQKSTLFASFPVSPKSTVM